MNTAGSYIKKFQQSILNTIYDNRLIDIGDAVVVGVSGGPDSVCLLHVLHSLKVELDTRLYAIHINHMLRAEESHADEKYTAEICSGLGIPLSVIKADIAELAKKSGMSLEEAGREVRYREFEHYAGTVGASKIAVAHNKNDQAETVMMHIIRGAGTAGLSGMEYKRGAVIRPLLSIYRKEIEQYCKEAGLLPRTDSSNLKSDFSRNRIRLELFPYINNKFGTDITESLCRLSSHAAEDNRYLDQCAADEFEKSLTAEEKGQVSLSLEQLGRLHSAILGRVLKQAITKVAGNSSGIGSVHYRALSQLVAKGKTGTQTELPGGLKAEVSYKVLKIHTHQAQQIIFNKPIIVPGITEIRELDAMIKTSIDKVINIDKSIRMGYNSFVQFFDYDSLRKGIHIRNRCDGDIFKPIGSKGTKKLKKYLIDIKMPREMRSRIPLVCIEDEVVWIVGNKISDKFKVTENTKSILKIEYDRRASL